MVVRAVQPTWNDVAVISPVATDSGTKCVATTHAGLVASVAGAAGCGLELGPDDVTVSYLSLAHSYERLVLLAAILGRAAIGFDRGERRCLVEDMAALKPTVFPTVPRILNNLYAKVNARASLSGCWSSCWYNKGVEAKLQGLDRGTTVHGFYDAMVFNQLAQSLGGSLRMIAVGGGPVSPSVMRFCRIAFGATVVSGYGGGGAGPGTYTASRLDDLSVGHCGPPLGSVEIALADVPTAGFFVDEDECAAAHSQWLRNGDGGPEPQVGGEVCVRGPGVGLYQGGGGGLLLEGSRVDSDGWYHTGDIGQWVTDNGSVVGGSVASGGFKGKKGAPSAKAGGSRSGRGGQVTHNLRVVDSTTRMFRLSDGLSVDPAKVETVLSHCVYVESVWVYGDPSRDSTVAFVLQNEAFVRLWATTHGHPYDEEHGLDDDDEFRAFLLEEFTVLADVQDDFGAPGLRTRERPLAVHVERLGNEWEVGHLRTSAFKLIRPRLREFYADEIAAMYTSLSPWLES